MLITTMKIPPSGASRLSTEAWINAEILKRYKGAGTIRKAIEAVLDEVVTKNLVDPEFVKIVQEVKAEGIEH